MGFAALFADKSLKVKTNIGGGLFGSSYIDKLAETLMGVLL
jgi:hypothetical protein